MHINYLFIKILARTLLFYITNIFLVYQTPFRRSFLPNCLVFITNLHYFYSFEYIYDISPNLSEISLLVFLFG